MKFSHKVVAGALSVALMGSVLYISSSNETDYVEIQNQVQINNKKKVDLQAEMYLQDKIVEEVRHLISKLKEMENLLLMFPRIRLELQFMMD